MPRPRRHPRRGQPTEGPARGSLLESHALVGRVSCARASGDPAPAKAASALREFLQQQTGQGGGGNERPDRQQAEAMGGSTRGQGQAVLRRGPPEMFARQMRRAGGTSLKTCVQILLELTGLGGTKGQAVSSEGPRKKGLSS